MMSESTAYNHYYDNTGLYTYSLPTGKGDCPLNASRAALPPKPWPVGACPCYDRVAGTWALEQQVQESPVVAQA